MGNLGFLTWLSWFPFFQWFLFPKPPKIGFGRVDLAFLLSASSYPFIASFSKTRREWNPDARSCFAGLFFPCHFQTPTSKLYAHEPELQALFISQIYCSFDFFSFPSAYGFESVLALEIIRSICGWPDLGFNVFLAPFFMGRSCVPAFYVFSFQWLLSETLRKWTLDRRSWTFF